MKKLIALILILAMTLPAAAFADVPLEEWVVEGNWMGFYYEGKKDENRLAVIVVLDDNNVAYYITQMFYKDEPGLGRSFIGTWEILADNIIHVVTGNNTSMNLQFVNHNLMLNIDDNNRMMFRAEWR